MTSPVRPTLLLAFVVTPLLLLGSEPWKTEPGKWTRQECQRLLDDSPWARPTGAVFALADEETPPAPPPTLPGAPEAGIAGPHSSAPRWDGGVQRPDRNLPPVLTVTVRWESAQPIQQALERLEPAEAQRSRAESGNFYVIVVKGLVPGGQYSHPELENRSGDTGNARNPENMLEGVMQYSRLLPRGKAAIPAKDAKLDPDGTLRIYFSRQSSITLDDKEAVFETRFGSISVLRKFRLKDMTYRGSLQL